MILILFAVFTTVNYVRLLLAFLFVSLVNLNHLFHVDVFRKLLVSANGLYSALFHYHNSIGQMQEIGCVCD